ncbi:WSC domain-containing protein [Colletotrichum scovillei]|nr:WSC domain-containing protein [Colletotrichum scovillei]
MAKRDSLTVWLPKEMYGSVEPLADDRFIWCPMPFDNSLPVEQTSFIDMGGDDEDNNIKEPARIPDDGKPMIDYELPAPPPAAVLAGPSMDMSTSETESEREFPMRQISQNLGRGRRRSRKTRPARRQQHKPAGSESRGFAVHLGLNLDIEVTLKARIFGDLEISALY